MKQIVYVIGGALLALLIIGGIAFIATRNTDTANKLTVVGSFYPLAHFAQQVGGDKIEVINLTPAGSEPHDFEPTPRDLATLQSAKLFLFNGAGLDGWAEKIEPDLASKGVTTLRMSDYVDLLQDEEAADDPHFWLDPALAQEEVALIATRLAQIDPTNATSYQANAADYSAQLAQLDADYQTGLTNCQKSEIITSHSAFGYLAKRYNLTVRAIAGLSPEAEPSAQELGELATLVREQGIGYIFFETLTSPKLAETLANEMGAQTLVFNPLEGLTDGEMTAGNNYISIMRDNLANLRTALKCQ